MHIILSWPGFVFYSTEVNQELIMVQGGIGLLSATAANAEDPQTLRMVAGAIANLCGNGNFLSIISLFLFDLYIA